MRLRRRARRRPDQTTEENAYLDLSPLARAGAGMGPVATIGAPLARALGPNAVLALQRTHGNRVFGGFHAKLIGLTHEKAGERINAATEESHKASTDFHATAAGSTQPNVKYVTCGGLQKVP